MSDQKFFGVPFAFGGDQSAVPDATQPDGSVSFTEGWGFDYQRDLATDPAAKPVDRSAENYLMFVVTQAIGALQRVGIPEWITPANNGGVALAYPKYAQVRYSATTPGVTFETYVSTVDGNTSVPGADNNWQPIASIVAAAADVVAGTSSRLIVTPVSLKSYPGNVAQTFNVAPATNPTHAMQLQQATGRLLRITRYQVSGGVQYKSVDGGLYTTVGANTFTSIGAVTRTIVHSLGAGSGAPGCPSTGPSNVAAAVGGTGGSYAEAMFVNQVFTGVPVVIGLGGLGGPAGLNPSIAGGDTTFGSGAVYVTCPGGPAVQPSVAVGPPMIAGQALGGLAPVVSSGVFLKSVFGGAGDYGNVPNFGVGVGGRGGASGDGRMGPTGGTNAPGAPALDFGCGGAGGSQTNVNSPAQAGGQGKDGYVTVFEFA
jgi:hypothetical protein